jgi:adenine-specific DNA-methyltransferase
MPTLHWIGKDKVINHHLDVPFKVLEHAYGFDNGTQTEQETNSGNKIIHGDNLEAHLIRLLTEGQFGQIFITDTHETRIAEIVEQFGVDYRRLFVEGGKVG